MIISQFWLHVRWNDQYPAEEFEVMVSNLEPVALRFRFGFVATQVSGFTDCTTWLRDSVEPLSHWKGLGYLLARQNWRRLGRLYTLRFDLSIAAGATHRTGIAAVKPIDLRGNLEPEVIIPGGVLRGHWELSLPALPTRTRGAVEAAQIDRPARMPIAAYHRDHRSESGRIIRDELRTLPLASGRSEHFIEPDRPRIAGVAAAGRRAPRRKGRAR